MQPRELKHLAIVMDGNGRWAEQRNWPRTVGHQKAEESIKRTVSFCLKRNVRTLTLFAFSTENWQRPDSEVNFILNLLVQFLERSYDLLVENQVRLNWVGEKDRLSASITEKFQSIIQLTSQFSKMDLCLAVDYGSRREIVSAAKKIAQQVQRNELEVSAIDEELFNSYLYTAHLPAVDLVIRTAGEQRLSNFLLWQSAYSEFFFSETLWPDFGEEDLTKAFAAYYQRNRSMGGVQPKIAYP